MRRTGEAGRALIEHFEGFSGEVYRCPAGYPTIGHGHRVRAGEDFTGGIGRAAARALLAADLAQAEAAVDRLLPVALTPGQFDALVSFAFNLGAGALQRSRLRACVLRGEYGAARGEFARWVYVGGHRSRGLMLRRAAEAALYAGGAV